MKKTRIMKFAGVIASFVMILGLLPNFSVSAAYENTHTNTGNYAYDIVEVAKTQVGYHETGNNDTKYNRWFGSLSGYGYNYAWCQTFVAWCAAQAGVPTSMIPRVSGTISAKDTFKKNGTYHAGPYEGGSYTPKKGDIIYFYSSGSESKHHVGIVSDCVNGIVYTIEGNSSDQVATRQYSVDNGNIRGYGVPNYPSSSVIPPKGHEMSTSEAAGQTIPDGDYYIFSAINQNYYVDIKGSDAIASEGTNIYMYTAESDVMPPEHDVWSIVYFGNGFYKIKQKGTNMCLDVNGAYLDRGTNVQVWTENDSLAQQWSIIRTDQGYKLQSRCNSFYLDVDGGVFENCTNVHVWENNDTSAQKFGLIPYGSSTGRIIEDGIYSIQSSVDSGYYIDASGIPSKGYSNETNIQLWENNSLNELFQIKYIDGYYEIYEVFSGLALDVWNGNSGNGYLDVNRNVQLYEKNHSRSQRWIIKNVGNSKYTLFSTLSGYCLDLDNGRCSNGNNIAQFWYNGGENQKWRFIKINFTSPTPTITTLSSSSLKLTWSTVTDAATYRIDRRKSGTDAYETIATTKDTTYTDKGLEANTKYWYRVYAVLGSEKSSEKNSVSGTTDKILTNCNIKLYDKGQCLAYYNIVPGTKLDEFLLPTMSKTGYKFEGWYTAKSGGTKYSIGSTVPKVSELNLYTHWTKVNIKGDVNSDDILSMLDTVLLQKHLLTLKDLTTEQLKLADMNSDGKVNIFDLALLKESLKQ